jgi:hypothetical protein
VVSSDRLEPGASGQIKATVETAGRMGRLEKYITVHSNDPVSPALTLSLSVEIEP